MEQVKLALQVLKLYSTVGKRRAGSLKQLNGGILDKTWHVFPESYDFVQLEIVEGANAFQ